MARALFYEAIFLSNNGDRKSLSRARAFIEKAAEIAKPINSPYLQAWQFVADGCNNYLGGEFLPAAAKLAAGEKLFYEQNGVAWEISSTRMFRMWHLLRKGAFAEMAPLLNAYLRDAEHRGALRRCLRRDRF